MEFERTYYENNQLNKNQIEKNLGILNRVNVECKIHEILKNQGLTTDASLKVIINGGLLVENKAPLITDHLQGRIYQHTAGIILNDIEYKRYHEEQLGSLIEQLKGGLFKE